MTALRVLEIFDSLQGEGVWAGMPMTFIRLAGCNAPALGLGCLRWCDTSDSWDPDAGEALAPTRVAERVDLPRVCLTGGEPLLQAEGVAELTGLLAARGVAVHVETNGTCPVPAGAAIAWLTVSPKPPDYLVVADLAGRVDELKIVVEAEGDAAVGVMDRLAAEHPEASLCLQPLAESEAARRAAVDLVMRHPDWRLSLQLHKVLGIP